MKKQSYYINALEAIGKHGVSYIKELSTSADNNAQKKILMPILRPVMDDVIGFAIGGQQEMLPLLYARCLHSSDEVIDVAMRADFENRNVTDLLEESHMLYSSFADVYRGVVTRTSQNEADSVLALVRSLDEFIFSKTDEKLMHSDEFIPVTLKWISQPHSSSLLASLKTAIADKRMSDRILQNMCQALWTMKDFYAQGSSNSLPALFALLICDKAMFNRNSAAHVTLFKEMYQIDGTRESSKNFFQRLIRAQPDLVSLATKSLDDLEF